MSRKRLPSFGQREPCWGVLRGGTALSEYGGRYGQPGSAGSVDRARGYSPYRLKPRISSDSRRGTLVEVKDFGFAYQFRDSEDIIFAPWSVLRWIRQPGDDAENMRRGELGEFD